MTISCILNMYLSLVLEVKMAEISWLADLSHAWESWAFRSRVQWWQGDTCYWGGEISSEICRYISYHSICIVIRGRKNIQIKKSTKHYCQKSMDAVWYLKEKKKIRIKWKFTYYIPVERNCLRIICCWVLAKFSLICFSATKFLILYFLIKYFYNVYRFNENVM